MSYIEGALVNQQAFLRQNPGQSLVARPVSDAAIRGLHAAHRDVRRSANVPLPDAIHAVEGLRRQADSLAETASAPSSSPLYQELAAIKASALRSIAGIIVNDVVAVYELSPEAQQELLDTSKQRAKR